jgi:UDP-2,3-diacylglucosamine hydrolase
LPFVLDFIRKYTFLNPIPNKICFKKFKKKFIESYFVILRCKISHLKEIILQEGKKLYFASDFHLGAPDHAGSLVREKKICSWLSKIQTDAQVLFLMGDLFDFWFEYKEVVPRGFTRFFGALAHLADAGVEIYVFRGNHDMWMLDYMTQECGAKIISDELKIKTANHSFYLAHGDGLGPGDNGYKRLKKIFRSPISVFLFRYIIPSNLGIWLGKAWASHSWAKHQKLDDVYVFESKEKEFLYQFCIEKEKAEHHDYYIFGHRHYALDLEINANSRYVNLGDWIRFYTYGMYDGVNLELKKFE